MRPELLPDSETFDAGDVLDWKVDWDNFVEEYPAVTGTADEWKLRLAVALERAWSP
jgi:hypothetical protein